MRLYSRKEEKTKVIRIIDSIAIYAATLYPLLYWHLHYTHQLSWFVKGDFIPIHVSGVDEILTVLYLLTLLSYIIKEIIVVQKSRHFNVPKNLDRNRNVRFVVRRHCYVSG